MQQHVKIVAILAIVLGAFMALAGLIVFLTVAGAGLVSGDVEAQWITGVIGVSIGGLLLVLSLPSLIGGFGLLKHRQWARILIIVVAALSLLNFPFGTAFGIYAIYVLLHDDVKPLFA